MADKMTKKERREAAKRARMEAQKRAARQRVMRRLYSTTAVVVVIGLIVFFAVRSGQESGQKVSGLNAAAVAAGCGEQQSVGDPGRNHVQGPVTYSVIPPTQGNHADRWWPSGGPQSTEIPYENLVHNLEHGAVVLHYKSDVAPDVKQALEDVASADDEWVLSVPDDRMTATVAFTAWGKLLTCESAGLDAAAIGDLANDFVDLNKRNAPEDVPLQAAAGGHGG